MPPLKQYNTIRTNDFLRPPPNNSSNSSNTSHNINNNNNNNSINNNLSVVCVGGGGVGGGVGVGSGQLNRKIFLNTQYAQKLLLNLNELRRDGRFCDVEIVADGKSFCAHRIILSASSAYFEAMFRPELGLCEGKQKSVVLHSIDPVILSALIDFVYTGQISIEQQNVQELLAAGDMLQIPEVVEKCCDFLCRELHPTNALGILRFAETHHCEQLAESALNFVHANFLQIAVEDEILDTPQTLLSRILPSELLRVDSENEVFHAALRWIKHDIVQRRQFVFDILSHIRLALVSPTLIDQSIDECRDMSVKIALRSVRKDLSSKRGQLVPLRVCPRACARKNIYIIGGAKRETSSGWNPNDCIFESVAKFDIFRKEWLEAAEMRIGRIQPGVATLGGKIYVFGGEKGSQILGNGEVYDPQQDQWTQVSSMIMPRCEFGLCQYGGTLWAVGGWFGVDIGGSIECYDPVKDLWTEMGEMPDPRFSMGVVSFENLIYAVGGCTTRNRHQADLISYNPVTREWTELTSMNIARSQMGVAVLDRYLYVIGGNDRNSDVINSVERYSFDDDQWVSMCPMQFPRASPAVCAADGLLYVIGGDQNCEVNFYRAQITLKTVECYNPLTNEWSLCPDLPASRSEAGAVVL